MVASPRHCLDQVRFAEQTETAKNGVNVTALLGAREALRETPEAARFKWRATSEWVKGTHNRATVDGFFGLGAEHQHRQS